MRWVIEAANEENSERHRMAAIQRGAPTLWKNICAEIEGVVQTYSRLEVRTRHVEFSGAANHTVFVAVYEQKSAGYITGAELGRVNITLNEEHGAVELVGLDGKLQSFPIAVDEANRVSLTFEGKAISIERFAEIALRDTLFPMNPTKR